MRAVVTNNSLGSDDDPRQVLAGWLDDYVAERCDRDELEETFISVARSNPDAPWTALALVDQYQRLGRIDTSLALALKATINQLAFGADKRSSVLPVGPVGPVVEQRHQPMHEPMPRRAVASPQVAEQDPDLSPSDVQEQHAVGYEIPTAIRAEPVRQPRKASMTTPARVLQQRYELLEMIHSNATGTAYRALDRQRTQLPLDARYVSVKIFNLDEAHRAASLAEMQHGFYQAQTLAHPNIRSVFDLGSDGDTWFGVMELLDGELLSTLLQEFNGRPMPRHYATGILSGIGAALLYAHGRNVIHGDLNPQNVMITSTGAVKVLEFGFASPYRLEPWISDEVEHVTSYEQTPEPYAADDVYSLACIAYELLSGRHPYDGDSVSLARVHGRKPSRNFHLNQRQWQVLQRALQLKRDERKINMRELLVGLGCEQPPPPLAPPAQILAKLDRPSWMRGALLAAASIVAIILIAYVYTQSSLTTSQPSGDVINQPSLPATTAPLPLSGNDIANTAPTETFDEPEVPATPASAPAAATTLPAIAETRDSASTPANSPMGTTTPTVAFTKDTFVASESDDVAKVVLRRSGPLNKVMRVRWSLSSNSAKRDEDYADFGPSIAEIPAGEREYTLLIPLASDTIDENTELLTVKLERVNEQPVLAQPAVATVIIVDDD